MGMKENRKSHVADLVKNGMKSTKCIVLLSVPVSDTVFTDVRLTSSVIFVFIFNL